MGAIAIAVRSSIKGIDQRARSGPYGDPRYIPIEDLRTWTGLGVSEETALNVVTVYQCIRVLAETFASVPLILYRYLPEGGKVRATDHPLYEVLRSRPNPDMSSFVWRELMMTHLGTWGNAYNEVVTNRDGSTSIWPVRPDRVEVSYDDDGRRAYDYLSPAGGRTRFRPGSILHVQGLSSDGLVGLSPVAVLRRSLALYRKSEQFADSVFTNGARPATVLQHPKTLSQPAIERLSTQMDRLRGAGNAGKTVVLEEGATVIPIGFPPEDAEFLQTRLFQKRELAAAYRVPPHKVGDLERATFSNIEHLGIEFISDTMVPWFARAEQEFDATLVNDDEYTVKFLADGYLRGDSVSRSSALATRWQHGTINADDWREIEDENPLPDGLGKTYYVPANYVPAATSSETPTDFATRSVPARMEEVRCASCSKFLGKASPPYYFDCPRCKSVTQSGEDSVSSGSTTDVVDGLRAAIRTLSEPPVVTVPAPTVTVETPPLDLTPVADAVASLGVLITRPIVRSVVRDDQGRIVGVVERSD